MDQPILIVGTGALATLFAARLSRAGCRVTMLGSWNEALEALGTHGARLLEAQEGEKAHPVRVANDPVSIGRFPHAIVLVKSWQTEAAARGLAACLAADGLALTLQNGLGNREILARELGPQRVALGTTTTGATLLGPGLVKAGGEGSISIEAHPALAPIEHALRAADFEVEIVTDARSLIWGKLVINAAINPLTALLRLPNGELLKRPAARRLLRALAGETAAVAAAENVTLPFDDPAAAAEQVARKTADNHSSMLQDVLRGAPTEIDAICGAIVRAGERHGLATPINRICWELLQAAAPQTPAN
jgi:2-dehydropantoate 2-reductase